MLGKFFSDRLDNKAKHLVVVAFCWAGPRPAYFDSAAPTVKSREIGEETQLHNLYTSFRLKQVCFVLDVLGSCGLTALHICRARTAARCERMTTALASVLAIVVGALVTWYRTGYVEAAFDVIGICGIPVSMYSS